MTRPQNLFHTVSKVTYWKLTSRTRRWLWDCNTDVPRLGWHSHLFLVWLSSNFLKLL